MSQNSTGNLGQITHLFTDIQKYASSLSLDARQLVYLFFVPRLSVADISRIYGLKPAKIHLIIGDFLALLLSKCKRLQAFLMHLPLLNKPSGVLHAFSKKWYMADFIYKAHRSIVVAPL